MIPIIIDTDDRDGDGIGDLIDNCQLEPNVDQSDADGDGCGSHCDADFDNNGVTNLSDFSLFRAAFGRSAPLSPAEKNAGLNDDGVINLRDFSLFRSMFGKAPGPSCCGDTYP